VISTSVKKDSRAFGAARRRVDSRIRLLLALSDPYPLRQGVGSKVSRTQRHRIAKPNRLGLVSSEEIE
jgi:hypothetical protein